MEYKVFTQKDRMLGGKFDPEAIEAALNAYAAEGWVLKGVASASFHSLRGGARDELILILERR